MSVAFIVLVCICILVLYCYCVKKKRKANEVVIGVEIEAGGTHTANDPNSKMQSKEKAQIYPNTDMQ